MSELSMRLHDEIESLRASGKIAELDDICRRALKASRRSYDTEGEAVALLGLAIAHRLRGDAYEAGVLADGAHQYAEKIFVDPLICDTWLEIGAYHRTMRLDYRPAMDAYQNAQHIAQNIAYDEGLARSLTGIAECYNDYRQFDKAYMIAQQALQITLETDFPYLMAKAYLASARANIGLKQSQKALDELNQAQTIAEKEHYPLIHALSAYHAGVLFAGFQDMYDQALTTLNAAREISIHTHYAYGEFLSLYGLSLTHDRHQAYADAREMCDSMSILAQETGNHAYTSAAFLTMAASFFTEGEYHLAYKQFTHALHETELHTLAYLRATSLIWLGRTSRADQQYEKTVTYARQAFTAFTAEGDHSAARDAFLMMVSAFVQNWWHKVMHLFRTSSGNE